MKDCTPRHQLSNARFPIGKAAHRDCGPIPIALCLLVVVIFSVFTSVAYAQGVIIGSQQLQLQRDSNAAGQAEAFNSTATASGTVVSLSIYVDAGSTATKLTVGLYADSAGKPGTLLTQGSLNSPLAGAWNTVTVPTVQVTSGATYWIAILAPAGSGGTLKFRDQSAGSRSETSASKTLTSLPSTWATGTVYLDSPLAAYASASGLIQPILAVSPASLSFAYTQGGT